MIVKQFKYFPFLLKLNAPFQNSSNIITERKGFIISMMDEQENISYAECSPLPGFSSETFDDVETILKGLRFQLQGFSFKDDLHSISEFLSEFKLVPSLRFALEQVILNLIVRREKDFLVEHLGKFNSNIPVNAVMGFGKQEDIISSISKKYGKGFRTFKIKIGRESFEDDFRLIENIHEKFGDTINLRLDVNGKWSLEAAVKYSFLLNMFNIQYIEEPCKGILNISSLAESSPIPIAVDESFHSINEAKQIIQQSKIDFIIFKPTILGALIGAVDFIKEFENCGKRIIISSSFESAVGKSALVMLAALTGHLYAHGLDISNIFANDICTDFYETINGYISFDPHFYPPLFDLIFK